MVRLLILTTIGTCGLVVGLQQPSEAQFFNPPIACTAYRVTADQVAYYPVYSEGERYWAWDARTRAECHFNSAGTSYDFQTYVRASLHYSYDSVNAIGHVNSPTWGSNLIYGTHTQKINNELWANYQWTSCVGSSRYVIKTEAFYRYKVRGSSSWSRWDSYQSPPASSANLKLC
jgi:hypothetical protein